MAGRRSSRARPTGRAPRTGLALALIALALLLPITTALSATVGTGQGAMASSNASLDGVPAIPAEGSATYSVNVSGGEETFVFRLNFTGESLSCRDGFGQESECVRVLIQTTVEGTGFFDPDESYLYSTDHAEFVSSGTWNTSRDPSPAQDFARPGPSWPGYPAPDTFDDRAWFNTGKGIMLLGIVAQTRAGPAGEVNTTFAGHPATLVTRPGAEPGPVVDIETSALWPGQGSADFRYRASFEQAPFPTTVELTRTDGEGHLLGRAELVRYTSSASRLDPEGWTPLHFPDVRDGLEPRVWENAPPGNGQELFLPIGWADTFGQHTPGGLLSTVKDAPEYLVTAWYFQEVQFTDEPLRPNEFEGEWELNYGFREGNFREVIVERNAPNTTRIPAVDTAFEYRNERPIPFPDFIPDREDLPGKLVTVDDASKIGRAAVPTAADEFRVYWDISRTPRSLGTAEAAIYEISCHRPVSFGVSATVSAVNGQLLSRGTLFGPPICLSPPS